MRIGDLARATGLSAATLRYYERIGLMPAPQRLGGKRWYDATGLRRALLLKVGRSAGLRIGDLVRLTRNAGDAAARRAVMEERGRMIERELVRLQQMRERLAAAAACGCADIAACSTYGAHIGRSSLKEFSDEQA